MKHSRSLAGSGRSYSRAKAERLIGLLDINSDSLLPHSFSFAKVSR
jgi:hypothetical protein